MDIKKPQLVKVGAFAYFFEGVLQHPPLYTIAYIIHYRAERLDPDVDEQQIWFKNGVKNR